MKVAMTVLSRREFLVRAGRLHGPTVTEVRLVFAVTRLWLRVIRLKIVVPITWRPKADIALPMTVISVAT